MVYYTHPAGSSGTYHRTGIPPGDYSLKVIARDPVRRDRKAITNRLWVNSDDINDPYCFTHLINHGWRVEGRNFTVEFTATGIATGFVCTLDRTEHNDCKHYMYSCHWHINCLLAENISTVFASYRLKPIHRG